VALDANKRPAAGALSSMAVIAHVLTLARVAELLGDDEDLLHELSIEMEPEDGMIGVHGVGDDYTSAFTQDGIEHLRYLIELHRADAQRASKVSPPQSDARPLSADYPSLDERAG
jgi:hypothetical protein